MNNNYRHILSLIILLAPFITNGQQQNLPLNREFGLVNLKVMNSHYSNTHTSFQPISQSHINLGESRTLELSKGEGDYYLTNTSKSEKKPSNFFKWMYRSAFYENLLVVDTGNFYLTIDPLINVEMGKDSEDTSGTTLYKNTRGAIIRANVGKKFSFETSFYENQMVLPNYMTSYANATEVIPGQGRWKAFKGNQGYDFGSASANLSYSPSKHFNFQLGTGKNFIGDGYRSLLLSDASFNYPFWKIISTFGKNNQFQYTKLNASLSSVSRRAETSTSEALFQRKTMSTHYFSWLATKWLNLGFFESTLWQTEDSTGTKPLQWQQFNPVVGVNTATTGFNDANHSIVGTNLKIKLPFKAILYSQFVYDGTSKFDEINLGYQIGARYFGIPNLTLQAEYNNVARETYSSDVPLQAHSNYNEALAHPSGNNFNEFVGIINYKYKRAFTQIKFNQIKYNEETFFSFDTYKRNIKYIQAHIGFIINPKNNLSVVAGVNQRTENIEVTNDQGLTSQGINKTNYVYFGIRTSLRNLYNDF